MNDILCLSCGGLVLDENEAALRHYRVIRTGTVFSRHVHDACHEKYLLEKPGISVSDVPPATHDLESSMPRPPRGRRPVPGPIPEHDPSAFSLSMGKGGTTLERNGHRIILPSSDIRKSSLSRFMSSRQEKTLGLGDSLRAKMLQARSRERDRR